MRLTLTGKKLRLPTDPEWWRRKIDEEGDYEIGAGAEVGPDGIMIITYQRYEELLNAEKQLKELLNKDVEDWNEATDRGWNNE